jgi:putative acetyltransferase
VIRAAVPEDAEALANVFSRSVGTVGLQDYTPEQIRAWVVTGSDVDAFARRITDGRHVFVATTTTGNVVGYIDIEGDGHIDHLYCAPEAVGHGVGAQLYDAVEAFSREHGSLRLHVEASETARRLFERKGFTLDARHDFVLDGVNIHNFAMSKELTA